MFDLINSINRYSALYLTLGAVVKRLITLLSLIYLALGSLAQAGGTKAFTKDVANEIAIHAMMASNAYVNDTSKTHFSIEELGWEKVDLNGNSVAAGKNSYAPKTFWESSFLICKWIYGKTQNLKEQSLLSKERKKNLTGWQPIWR